MIKIILLFVFVTFSTMTSFAQNREDIKTIKSNFSRINSIKNWTSIKKIDTDDSTEGGFINYYFLNDNLEKIVVQKYGESGNYLSEYYITNAQLSFVFEQHTTYNFPLYWKEFDAEKSKIEEKRYYFDNNKLLHFIGISTNIGNESNDVLNDYYELIHYAK